MTAQRFSLREKHHPHPVPARFRQGNVPILTDAPEKLMGDLQKNPRAVTGAGVTTLRPAMMQIFQHPQGFFNNLVGLAAFDVGHKANAARILLKTGDRTAPAGAENRGVAVDCSYGSGKTAVCRRIAHVT